MLERICKNIENKKYQNDLTPLITTSLVLSEFGKYEKYVVVDDLVIDDLSIEVRQK